MIRAVSEDSLVSRPTESLSRERLTEAGANEDEETPQEESLKDALGGEVPENELSGKVCNQES